MKLENLARIKELRSVANQARGLTGKYRDASADPRCDKHGMAFGRDGRFSVFSASVSLDAYLGYYGNSTSSAMGIGISSKDAQTYLTKALNAHIEAILQTMAMLMDQDATALRDAAEAEIHQANKMLAEMDEVNA